MTKRSSARDLRKMMDASGLSLTEARALIGETTGQGVDTRGALVPTPDAPQAPQPQVKVNPLIRPARTGQAPGGRA